MASPFRADHVGSLLRPPELIQARADYREGRLSADGLVERRGTTMILPALDTIVGRSVPADVELTLSMPETASAEQALH